ncbi:MAG: ABATE domain-containing protein [Anaerolineales bacterium]
MPKREKSTSDPKNPRLCLEFTNTVAWHASPTPEERLHTYEELVRWARTQNLLTQSATRKLIGDAADRPADAGRALKRAVILREAIYRIFAASVHGLAPTEADIADLNQAIRKLTDGAQIRRTAEGYAWDWNVDPHTLDSLLGPVALSAAELLVSKDLEHVGQCADERGCGWLFLDTSKNHSRRWCDAGDCGNRARQRRFQERARKPG